MAKKKKTSNANAQQTSKSGNPTGRVPVAAIGGSAGGLQALKAFFAEVPEDSPLAYFVLVHSNPDSPTMLPELLGKVAGIPISLAEDKIEIAAGHAYVVPPATYPTFEDGIITLHEVDRSSESLPIDLMFGAVVDRWGEDCVGVVLSGNGSDGSQGLKKIKEANGFVIVQSLETAEYAGMPQSAIDTGLVDLVLAPAEMPSQVHAYFDSFQALRYKPGVEKDQKSLKTVCAIIQTRLGHDFSDYKTNSIGRRIARRMSMLQIDELPDYVNYLRDNAEEVETLFRELLIGVTRFFRDSEAFEELKSILESDVLPGLDEGDSFRVWVPGCSTGEEIYSLAMILHECLDGLGKTINLQLFGSDIDERAIATARKGIYPSSIGADVSPERLKRFFTRENDSYRIQKGIRDDIVFSLQNVLRDPPFSGLNLLCCRNLLIYLNAEIQGRLIPLFHHSLVPGGLMMLGPSESISRYSELFTTKVKQWRIFQSREVPKGSRYHFSFIQQQLGTPNKEAPYGEAVADGQGSKTDLGKSAKAAALEHFTPTTVLVDQKGEILHILGRSGYYLEYPSGTPTNNIINLARQGLRIELSSALRQAVAANEKVTRKQLKVKSNGDYRMVDLHVVPHPSAELKNCLLVAFADTMEVVEEADRDTGSGDSGSQRIAELEEELLRQRENNQASIEELDTTNEELKSTNEELQSTNEELQSSNEELESSKEELQSLNEEMQTVNAELQGKVDQLSASHDDMRNLLNSTHIATVFVDNDGHVRRFTEEVAPIINLIHGDIGRPLRHVATNLQDDGLEEDIARVLKDLVTVTREVRTTAGDWYVLRIVPYRSQSNRIDGAVITFSDINEQKRTQRELEESRKRAESAWALVRHVFDMNEDPAAVLDNDGLIVIANQQFSRCLDIESDRVAKIDFLSLEHEIFRAVDLPAQLRSALEQNRNFRTDPFTLQVDQEQRRYHIRGRVINAGERFPYRILLTFEENQE